MIGRLRRLRLSAPVLVGVLLAGGCQLPGSTPLTPPGNVGEKTSSTGAPAQGSAVSAGPKTDSAADQTAVLGTPRAGQAPARRDTPAPSLDPDAREATTVDYVPPGASSPYNCIVPAVATSPSPAQPGAVQQTGRVVTLTPGEFRIERNSETALKVDSDDAGAKKQEARMRQLEQRLEQRDRFVRQSGTEMQASNEELRKTLAQVETLRTEVDGLRTRLATRDKDDLETLQMTVKALEKLLGEDDTTRDR